MLSSSVLVFSEREKVKKKAVSCFVYTYEERNDALLTMHKRINKIVAPFLQEKVLSTEQGFRTIKEFPSINRGTTVAPRFIEGTTVDPRFIEGRA